jgi:hypothetical protein
LPQEIPLHFNSVMAALEAATHRGRISGRTTQFATQTLGGWMAGSRPAMTSCMFDAEMNQQRPW